MLPWDHCVADFRKVNWFVFRGLISAQDTTRLDTSRLHHLHLAPPPSSPTFICDGAVGIADVLIIRQHILSTQDKHTQHVWATRQQCPLATPKSQLGQVRKKKRQRENVRDGVSSLCEPPWGQGVWSRGSGRRMRQSERDRQREREKEWGLGGGGGVAGVEWRERNQNVACRQTAIEPSRAAAAAAPESPRHTERWCACH